MPASRESWLFYLPVQNLNENPPPPSHSAGNRITGDRLVDPEAAAAQPQGGDGRGARSVQKKVAEVVAWEAARHPSTPIETFATDEHRIGLKPVTRRVWATVGERPTAHGHHRFE